MSLNGLKQYIDTTKAISQTLKVKIQYNLFRSSTESCL